MAEESRTLLSRIAVVPARDKQDSHALAPLVIDWLIKQECTVINEDELRAGETADVIIALGGDGLMMRMGHLFPGIPLLGINFGRVGFLAMVEREDWEAALTRLLTGDFAIQDGPTLRAGVQRDGHLRESGWAINDVVLRSGMQMIDVELYVDGQYVNTYPGDGMIVASPQGSTAYCMAAGGPILTAGVRGFAVTPISPHSPIRTSLVVPEDADIELVLASDRDAFLILDGNLIEPLQRGDMVEVHRGSERFRLIIPGSQSFYTAFQSKFNYLIRPEATPTLGHFRADHDLSRHSPETTSRRRR